MGDKSPKSNKKLASQKQDKVDRQNRVKQAEVDAGHARKARLGKASK